MTPEHDPHHPASRALAGTTILQIVPTLAADWLGRATLDIATALLRAGARAVVASPDGPLVGDLQALGAEWVEVDPGTLSPLRAHRQRDALAALTASERFDVVHAVGNRAARLGLKIARTGRRPLATTYVGVPRGMPMLSLRGPEPMARGDVVIAFSEYAADLIAAHRAIPRERIEVIHGCVDVAQFDPEAVAPGRAEALRAAWRIPPTDRVVLAPGRLAGENGQMPLVDAARILVNGGLRHTTFVIAGVPKRRESVARALEKRVVAQGVRPLFRRVGHCADMPALYALADFVVLPLEHMPYFSTTAAEAQAMARPLVVTRTGALPEYVRAPPRDFEGLRTGWIVQPGDPLDLARGLAAALALTPQALGAVSARARALAIAKFSRQHNTGATLAIYARLLDRTTAPIASAQGED